ncbi:MAG: helix-turn-helix transcriptional regulator [Planctomycetota bacterium]
MSILKKSTLDGNIETLLLALLAESPGYGYQLVRDLNERADGLLKLGEGTVYPVLHRMEERGQIKAYWSESDTGRPRKYYRLSPRGKRVFAEKQQQWAGLIQVMQKVVGPGLSTPPA